MKLQNQLNRVGLSVALAVGPSLAFAAEGGSVVGDNIAVLGIVAALVVFAFLPKGGKKAAPVAESAPAAAESEPAAEEAEAEAPVTESEPVAEEAASEVPAAEGEAPAAEAASEEAPAESESAAS
ncbi:hypothetical protein [Methylomagnum sp.]